MPTRGPSFLLLPQGLLRAPKESIPTEVGLVKLWRHECCRVFADKLTTLEDRSAFLKELDHQTAILGRAVLSAPQVKRNFGEILQTVSHVWQVIEFLVYDSVIFRDTHIFTDLCDLSIVLPGASHAICVIYVAHFFLGLDLYSTDPAQHLKRAGYDIYIYIYIYISYL